MAGIGASLRLGTVAARMLGVWLLLLSAACRKVPLDPAPLPQRDWTPAVATAVREAAPRLDGLIVLGADLAWKDGQAWVSRPALDWGGAAGSEPAGGPRHADRSDGGAARGGWGESAALRGDRAIDGSEELADVLNTGGAWSKDRDEKLAGKYDQAIVQRIAGTKIGRAAKAKHWFVDEFRGPWSAPLHAEREAAANPR